MSLLRVVSTQGVYKKQRIHKNHFRPLIALTGQNAYLCLYLSLLYLVRVVNTPTPLGSTITTASAATASTHQSVR